MYRRSGGHPNYCVLVAWVVTHITLHLDDGILSPTDMVLDQ